MIKRLVDLLVKSVDLVDIPANQRPFILVKNKNQQEAEMSTKDAEKDRAIEAAVADAGGDTSGQQDKGEAAQVEKQQEAKPATDTKPVEKQQEAKQEPQEPELPEEVQKAMADADAIFAEDDVLTQVKDLVTQITEKAMDPSKAGAAIGQAMTMLEGAAKMAGMPAGAKLAIGRALGLLSKVKGYAAPGGAAMAKAGYKKPDETMKDVEKAGAAMSKARMDQLEQALNSLTKAGEQLKALFEGVSGAKKAEGTQKDVAKAEGEVTDINKALEGATKTIQALNERISKMEGTVTVSKAADGGDGEGDKAGTVEKSFWSGVI